MNDVISVIVPVYNVARYLPQCLDSILSQDHRDLEVIVIDDGSTDGSGAICDEYARRDSRVRVIHQKNGGAAAAKNAGLRVATGEYLSFVDSDDFLEPDVYGYMLGVLKSQNADAAQFNFRDVYKSHTEDQVLWRGQGVMNSKEYLLRFPKDWTCALLWNKLYRRAVFDGVFFEEGHKIDDEYFTYRGFLQERRIVWEERIIYNYRKRISSVMASPSAAERRLLDCMDAIGKRREAVSVAYPDLRREFDESYLDAIWYLSGNSVSEETIALLQSRLKEYLRTWGNTFPPRYLWPMLWHLAVTRPQKLVQENGRKESVENTDDYFA